MRLLLILLVSAFLPACIPQAFGQTPFETDFLPTFSFEETIDQKVQGSGVNAEVVTTSKLKITARASMKGVELESINSLTRIIISVADLIIDTDLSADPTYDDSNPSDRTVNIPLNRATEDGEVTIGTLGVTWSATAVNVTMNVTNGVDPSGQTDEITLLAKQFLDVPPDENIQDESNLVTLEFADRQLEQVLYVKPFPTMTSRSVRSEVVLDGTTFTLTDVDLFGEIDSDFPTATITSHRHEETLNVSPITLAGTASDENGVISVEARINGQGAWLPAALNGNNWELTNVPLSFRQDDRGRPIPNTIELRVTDEDDHVGKGTRDPFSLFFSRVSDLQIDATGTAAGQVTGAIFSQKRQTPISFVPGSGQTRVLSDIEEGKLITLIAKPAKGASFGGWTVTNGVLGPEQLYSERLTFRMQSSMRLTASFVPNPFGTGNPVPAGFYNGLVGSASPQDRGYFSGKIATTGAFSGKVRFGTRSLSLKGKFTGLGFFGQAISKSGEAFVVQLSLNVTGDASRVITGTLTGPGITATIGGDLGVFHAKNFPAPDAGTYTALLTPAITNSDGNFPIGIGYGKLTVTTAGKVRFVGKGGDSISLSASGTLSDAGVWPFALAPYPKGGAISGAVTFAPEATPTLDAEGTISWMRSGVTKPGLFSTGYVGAAVLSATRFVAPVPGTLAVFAPDGALTVMVDGRTAPTSQGNLPFLNISRSATLSTTYKLDLPAEAGGPAIKFSLTPKNGTFSGSLVETLNGKNVTSKFQGMLLSPKGTFAGAAGGYFIRGTRTGGVELVDAAVE